MFLIRVTHSSGMLEGQYTEETTFPANDHRNHRPRSWLLNGIKKVAQLRFLEGPDRTLGQAALLWLLADDRVASTLPNIYDEKQLLEFAAAPGCPGFAGRRNGAHRATGGLQFRRQRRSAPLQKAPWEPPAAKTPETAAAAEATHA